MSWRVTPRRTTRPWAPTIRGLLSAFRRGALRSWAHPRAGTGTVTPREPCSTLSTSHLTRYGDGDRMGTGQNGDRGGMGMGMGTQMGTRMGTRIEIRTGMGTGVGWRQGQIDRNKVEMTIKTEAAMGTGIGTGMGTERGQRWGPGCLSGAGHPHGALEAEGRGSGAQRVRSPAPLWHRHLRRHPLPPPPSPGTRRWPP